MQFKPSCYLCGAVYGLCVNGKIMSARWIPEERDDLRVVQGGGEEHEIMSCMSEQHAI